MFPKEHPYGFNFLSATTLELIFESFELIYSLYYAFSFFGTHEGETSNEQRGCDKRQSRCVRPSCSYGFTHAAFLWLSDLSSRHAWLCPTYHACHARRKQKQQLQQPHIPSAEPAVALPQKGAWPCCPGRHIRCKTT